MRGSIFHRPRFAAQPSVSLLGRTPGHYAGDPPSAVARAAFAALDASTRVVDANVMLPIAHSTRPMRIAVLAPGRWLDPILDASGALACEWLALAGLNPSVLEGDDPFEDLRTLSLDAIVSTTPDGGLLVHTPCAPRHDAAWFDWNQPRPLSYGGIFPMRIDVQRVSIPPSNSAFTKGAASYASPELVRLIIESAALFSRVPARLERDQLNRGRAAVLAPVPAPLPRHWSDNDTDTVDQRTTLAAKAVYALRDMLFEACHRASEQVWTPESRVAARLAGAWAATDAPTPSLELRRTVLEWCAAALPDDPETLLRLGAARVSVLDDIAGFNVFDRAAARILADKPDVVDASCFVLAELEHNGEPDNARLGRVAAGVCMLASTCPVAHVPHVLDDLREDMLKSEMLVGMDQDRRVLEETFSRVRFARLGPASFAATEASAMSEADPTAKTTAKPTAKPTTKAATNTSGRTSSSTRSRTQPKAVPSGSKPAPNSKATPKAKSKPQAQTKRAKPVRSKAVERLVTAVAAKKSRAKVTSNAAMPKPIAPPPRTRAKIAEAEFAAQLATSTQAAEQGNTRKTGKAAA